MKSKTQLIFFPENELILTKEIEKFLETAIKNNYKHIALPWYYMMKNPNDYSFYTTSLHGFDLEKFTMNEFEKTLENDHYAVERFIGKNFENYQERLRTECQKAHARGIRYYLCCEMLLLNEVQLQKFIEMCITINANGVSTSAGYNVPTNYSIIRKAKKIMPPRMYLKAQGGVKTIKKVDKLLNAGSDWIGTTKNIY